MRTGKIAILLAVILFSSCEKKECWECQTSININGSIQKTDKVFCDIAVKEMDRYRSDNTYYKKIGSSFHSAQTHCSKQK